MSPGSKNKSAESERERISHRKQTLRLRALMVQAIRDFFMRQGYLEVETPILIPAPAPELHIDAIPAKGGYLQTSPELYMKRLLAAGYERIFQMCRCFRQGERGDLHLPEFTILEWYSSHAGYRDIMFECEAMIQAVAKDLGLPEKIQYRGRAIDLGGPWERVTVHEAFERYGTLSLEKSMEKGRFDVCMVEEIEPHLGSPEPTFLCDYPASMAALARLKPDNARVAERFELYMGGVELANAFTELTDPAEQRARFQEEKKRRGEQGREAYPFPEKFLEALALMPEAAGIALGFDRLAMIFSDSATIDQVVAFTPEEL
jgi:elongation factor P--(R)-beta-lysine ligase